MRDRLSNNYIMAAEVWSLQPEPPKCNWTIEKVVVKFMIYTKYR